MRKLNLKLSEAQFRETPHKVDVREMYSLTDAHGCTALQPRNIEAT